MRGQDVNRHRPREADGVRSHVSVVIPCYNYATYLPQAVGSVLTQEGVDVEVVVVDDASSDDSLSVAEGLAAADSRVRVEKHEVNHGPVQSFNDGIPLCRGEFLVRLDADDLLTPGSLARSTLLARAYPSVGLVYGHPIHFYEEPPPAVQKVTSWTLYPGRTWLADRCRDGFNVITSPEVLMRLSVVREVGGQQPLAHTHDMEMWFRMAAFSDVGHIEGADQAWHREHPRSRSATQVDPLRDIVERRAAFDALFTGKASVIPRAAELHRRASRTLALHAVQDACHEFNRGRNSPELVDGLKHFATSVWPEVVHHRNWRALRRRERLGAEVVGRLPTSVGQALLRRLEADFRRRRWTRKGVYR